MFSPPMIESLLWFNHFVCAHTSWDPSVGCDSRLWWRRFFLGGFGCKGNFGVLPETEEEPRSGVFSCGLPDVPLAPPRFGRRKTWIEAGLYKLYLPWSISYLSFLLLQPFLPDRHPGPSVRLFGNAVHQ